MRTTKQLQELAAKAKRPLTLELIEMIENARNLVRELGRKMTEEERRDAVWKAQLTIKVWDKESNNG